MVLPFGNGGCWYYDWGVLGTLRMGVFLVSVMGVLQVPVTRGAGVLLVTVTGGCWLLLGGGFASYCDWGRAGYSGGGDIAPYCDSGRWGDVAGYYNWPVGVACFWSL